MAHREYTNREPAVASTNALGSKTRAEANKLIRDSEFEFYEHDIFEVQNVFLKKMLIRKTFGAQYEEKYYGGIYGSYVHNKTQKTLPTGNSPVLPLDPNIRRYPVEGEYVVCINHMGRTYYKTIINHNNNPNNNIQVGASSNSRGNKKVKHTIYTNNPDYNNNIEASPGDMILQGRFGNSICLGSHQLTASSIKLVAGVNDSGIYNINKDGASIYIQDGGSVNVKNPNKKFRKYPVVGSKVVINADEIVLNARKNIKIVSGNRTEILGKDIELKHNKGGSIFTGETKELLDNQRDILKDRAIREIELCIEQLLLVVDKGQEDFERLKRLIDKVRDIPELSQALVDRILGAEISINSEKFSELQNKYNRLTKEMGAIPDKTKDPVQVARILVEMAGVMRDFADYKELFRPNIKLGKPS
jgi:hypothetical protein